MRFTGALLVGSLVIGASASIGAQTNNCPAPGAPGSITAVTEDACWKGADIFAYMLPQLGNGIAGGNTTPGQGGSLGGFPHFALSVRVTGAPDAALPDFGSITMSGTGRQNSPPIPIKKQAFGLGAIDAAVGVFEGFKLGVGTVGGVDVLVSASYVPNYESGPTKLKVDNPIALGYGARIGLFNGTAMLPSVGVSYLQRTMPKMTLTASASGTDNISLQNLDLKTTSWRLTATQSLVLFGLNAGYGEDTYDGATGYTATVSGQTMPLRTVSATVKRTNWFAGVTFNLVIFKLVGEYGQVSGGDLTTFNGFGSSVAAGGQKTVNDSKNYFSAALRFGF